MTEAASSLHRSVYDTLVADPVITALLGGTHVYDHVPRGSRFPYITFDQTSARDWSTGSGPGYEHFLTLHVWSQAPGRAELHDIMAAVYNLLHDQQIAVSGFHLINLRQQSSEVRRENDGETWRGVIRLRGVTEPID